MSSSRGAIAFSLPPELWRPAARLGLRVARSGDVKWDPIVRALNRIGYQGPLSIEWEIPAWTASLAHPKLWP